MLGEWSRDPAYLKKLAGDFQSAEPYPHVIIPNFFSEVRQCGKRKSWPSFPNHTREEECCSAKCFLAGMHLHGRHTTAKMHGEKMTQFFTGREGRTQSPSGVGDRRINVLTPPLPQEIASRIDTAFPIPDGNSATRWRAQGWHVYDNPMEGKLVVDNIDIMKRHDSIFGCALLLMTSFPQSCRAEEATSTCILG